MKCKNCENELSEGIAFCPYCGTAVTPETEPEFEKNCCPQCGGVIEPDTLFCPDCGCKLTDNEIKKVEQTENTVLSLQENKKYSVVITGTKSGPLPLVNLIRAKTGLDLVTAQKLANNLPLSICSDLSYEAANSTVVELAKMGIIASVQGSACEVGISEVVSDSKPNVSEKKTFTYAEKKKKLKTVTIVGVVGVGFGILALLFMLLLPLFTTTYTETLGEETIVMEKNVSLLVFIVQSAVSLFSAMESSYGYLSMLWMFLRVIVSIQIVYSIVLYSKSFIGKIKNLVKFEEYSKQELTKDAAAKSAEEVVKTFNRMMRSNTGISIIIYLLEIIIIFGYGTINWGVFILVAVLICVSAVVEKVEKEMKKKISDSQNQGIFLISK